MRHRSGLVVAGAALVALALLPVVSAALGPDPGERCAVDGTVPGSVIRLRATSPSGTRVFCSVRCAEVWDRRSPEEMRNLVVLLEDTSTEAPIEQTTFVRSTVQTLRASAECLHAFSTPEAAAHHTSVHGGRILKGDDRPFPRRSRP